MFGVEAEQSTIAQRVAGSISARCTYILVWPTKFLYRRVRRSEFRCYLFMLQRELHRSLLRFQSNASLEIGRFIDTITAANEIIGSMIFTANDTGNPSCNDADE